MKASGIGLGFKSLVGDLGYELPCRVWTDSSAAMGIVGRQGLGKLRHIDTHSLWVQQAARSGRISVRKVRGEENPADLFTKHLCSREKVTELVRLIGCRYEDGRPEAAARWRWVRDDADLLLKVQRRSEEAVEVPPVARDAHPWLGVINLST